MIGIRMCTISIANGRTGHDPARSTALTQIDSMSRLPIKWLRALKMDIRMYTRIISLNTSTYVTRTANGQADVEADREDAESLKTH